MPIYKIILYAIASIYIAMLLHNWLIKDKNKKRKVKNNGDDLSKLITACLGDKAKAIRLIDYEQKIKNGLSRKEAIKYAIAKLTRDRS
ncbi:MAG: hypothetical protein WBP13_01600 [Methylophilaceae bacterium]